MGFQEANEAVEKEPTGGRFLKLKKRGDFFTLELTDIDIIDRKTPKGKVVTSEKTGKVRKVWRLVMATKPEDEEDNGVRLYDANESAQSAIRDAVKESGARLAAGGTITLGVEAENGEYDQMDYRAKWEPAPKVIDVPAADDSADEDDNALPF